MHLVIDYPPFHARNEPHRCHCVVSLSKTHLSLLSTGSTQEGPSRQNWWKINLESFTYD